MSVVMIFKTKIKPNQTICMIVKGLALEIKNAKHARLLVRIKKLCDQILVRDKNKQKIQKSTPKLIDRIMPSCIKLFYNFCA